MSTENKDIIAKNIEARVNTDFEQFKQEMHSLLLKYLPHSLHSFSYTSYSSGDKDKYITGEAAPLITPFLKAIEPHLKAHATQKREKEFSEILTNLGSYLEMINQSNR